MIDCAKKKLQKESAFKSRTFFAPVAGKPTTFPFPLRMADFDICNVYKRRPSKRKGDKGAKKHKGPSFKTFLETRQKYGVDGTRSDTEDSDSDDYSTRRNKKKPKLLYSEFNKRRQSEEVSEDKERDESLDEPATNNTSFSTEPSAEPEPITTLNEKLEATCIELSDDEDISYSFPPRITQDPPPLRPPPPVVPSIEEMTDLDPDLMKIVTAPTAAHDPSSAHPTSAAKLEKVCIKVQYVSLKKTDDRVMLEAIRLMEEPLKVYLMENDPFEKLLQWFCSKRLLAKNNILLVYDDTPVMPRATPASLHMITGKKGKNLISMESGWFFFLKLDVD
ncbi:hypothetical protein BJV82DRAFT_123975 [Fennellomyces sp. T-0311]|nr:hypothetical protein BJV82DRAFT_123975 [Fennellomyces sp. T-0311]